MYDLFEVQSLETHSALANAKKQPVQLFRVCKCAMRLAKAAFSGGSEKLRRRVSIVKFPEGAFHTGPVDLFRHGTIRELRIKEE